MTGSTTGGKVITLVVIVAVAVVLAIQSWPDPDEDPPETERAAAAVQAVPLDGGPAVGLDLVLADDERAAGAIDLGDAVLVAVTPDDRFDGRLVAFDPATGAVVATSPVPDGATARVEEAVTWGDLVLVPLVGDGVANGVVAIDRATGTPAWTSTEAVRVEQVVVVDEDTAAVVESSRIRFVDRTGATTATSSPLPGTTAPGGAVVIDGQVVVVLGGQAVAVAGDGAVGSPVALPDCARTAGDADGDLLVVATTGEGCTEEDGVARVSRIAWPSGELLWATEAAVAEIGESLAVLVHTEADAAGAEVVVAVGTTGLGGHAVTTTLDPEDGTPLGDDPGDVVIGPDDRAWVLAVASDPVRTTLQRIDLRTGAVDGAPVDTGTTDLPIGLTATHVLVEDRGRG